MRNLHSHFHFHFRRLWPYYITIYYEICASMNSLTKRYESGYLIEFSSAFIMTNPIELNWHPFWLPVSFFLPVTEAKYQCESEGYQKDPEDCTKFYRCVDNGSGKLQAIHFDCAPGTIFSTDIGNCDHPSNANRPECPNISENLVDGGNLILLLISVFDNFMHLIQY